MTLKSFVTRHIAWIAGVIAIAAYYPRFIKYEGGLAIFSGAAECMLRGETPLHCKTVLFAYPPFFALLSIPIAAMPIWIRPVFWYLIVVGTLVAALQLCEALARRIFAGDWTARELAQFRVLTFVLSAKFILAVLENQAFDTIAFFFILIGLVALVTERWFWAGAALSVATALKVTPLIFLPYLLLKRRFASAAVFVVGTTFLTLFPDILIPPSASWHASTWLREVVLASFFDATNPNLWSFWVTNSPMNQSFRAAIARVMSGGDHSNELPRIFEIMRSKQFSITLYSVVGLYVLGIGSVMLKSFKDNRLIAIDGALLVISGLLLSPVSSKSHFVGLMLPYAILAAFLIKESSTRASTALVLFASFVLATATSNDLAGRTVSEWALWNSLPILGVLVLIVGLNSLVSRIGSKSKIVV